MDTHVIGTWTLVVSLFAGAALVTGCATEISADTASTEIADGKGSGSGCGARTCAWWLDEVQNPYPDCSCTCPSGYTRNAETLMCEEVDDDDEDNECADALDWLDCFNCMSDGGANSSQAADFCNTAFPASGSGSGSGR
jgi:hypothetical protein